MSARKPLAELLLLLDFDGTLARLRRRPEDAGLSAKMAALLGRLADSPKILLAIVSGRDYADLRAKVGIDGIVYASNHGYAIRGPGMSSGRAANARDAAKLARAAKLLKELASGVRGVFIEKKDFSVSFHYRKVRDGDHVLRAVLDKLPDIAEKLGLKILYGKKVAEFLLPRPQDKGLAVKTICRLAGAAKKGGPAAVYIGDDTTDEAAFAALRGRGFTVKVGRGKTSARYRLNNTEEVFRFLSALAKA